MFLGISYSLTIASLVRSILILSIVSISSKYFTYLTLN